MQKDLKVIPQALVYEMQQGQAIYYRGYKEVMDGHKQLNEIMGSSFIQSLIISRLVFRLQSSLSSQYEVLTNEIGIQFAKNSWRAADIVILLKEDLQKISEKNTYLDFSPEIVIEIDTKAELSEIKNPFAYYHEKTDEFLAFGVKKVIWIFTETQKVMLAEAHKKWETGDWDQDVEILEGLAVNIASLLDKS